MAHRAGAAPYPPGWLDRLLDFIEAGLPGSNAAWCLLLVGLQAAWVLAMLWWTDQYQPGHGGIPWGRLFSVVITPALLLTRFHLDAVAADCMDRFRPMLPVGDEEFERLRYELTTLSARTTNIVTATAVTALVANAIVAPDSWVSQWGGSRELAWLKIAPVMLPTVAVIAVSLAQAVHQLRMVDRIHRLVGTIDIRRAKPLHAFSRLTALTGMSFLVLASYVVAMRFDLVESLPAIGFFTFAMVPVGIACFLLPLRGMHERLVAAKERAIDGVEDRLGTLFARIHRQVDAGSGDETQTLKQQIDSLVIELESLKKISTWPWETSTLTGFLSTLVLPILLWVLQRRLERSGF